MNHQIFATGSNSFGNLLSDMQLNINNADSEMQSPLEMGTDGFNRVFSDISLHPFNIYSNLFTLDIFHCN